MLVVWVYTVTLYRVSGVKPEKQLLLSEPLTVISSVLPLVAGGHTSRHYEGAQFKKFQILASHERCAAPGGAGTHGRRG